MHTVSDSDGLPIREGDTTTLVSKLCYIQEGMRIQTIALRLSITPYNHIEISTYK